MAADFSGWTERQLVRVVRLLRNAKRALPRRPMSPEDTLWLCGRLDAFSLALARRRLRVLPGGLKGGSTTARNPDHPNLKLADLLNRLSREVHIIQCAASEATSCTLDDKLRPEWIDEVRYLFGPHVQRRLAALNKAFGELMEALNSEDERLKRQLDGLGEEGRG